MTARANFFPETQPGHATVILPDGGAVTTYRSLADNIDALV